MNDIKNKAFFVGKGTKTYKSEELTINADKGLFVDNRYEVGEPVFRGIYVPIDRVFFTKDNGEKVTAEEWLKGILREVINDGPYVKNDEEFNKRLEKWKKQNWEYNPFREKQEVIKDGTD